MNFYRSPADDRCSKPAAWQSELNTKYTVIAQPTRRDVILFLRPDDLPIHTALYVADEVVFLRTVGDDGQPWILIKWDDLLARHPQTDSLRPLIFHRNRPPE